jgi:hypothetical protein
MLAFPFRWQVRLPALFPTLALVLMLAVVPISARAQTGCGNASYVPAGCQELAPGQSLPARVTQCYCIDQASGSPYVAANVNVLDGGAIYFVEDPGKTIDFQVSSLLI